MHSVTGVFNYRVLERSEGKHSTSLAFKNQNYNKVSDKTRRCLN